MTSLVTSILILHVAAGTTALLVGLVPMFSQKGGKLHNRTGLVYVWCMIIVAVTALLVCVLKPFSQFRLFLTGVAVMSFYLCMTGWRITKQKKSEPTQGDKMLTYVTLVVSMAMLSFGAYLLTDGPSVFAILFSLFGFFTFKNAWFDFKSFRKTPEKMHWFYHHITRMGGSYIATFTAFLVNNMYRMLPENAPAGIDVVGWIAPGLVGGILIGRTIKYYKQKFNKPKVAVVAQIN